MESIKLTENELRERVTRIVRQILDEGAGQGIRDRWVNIQECIGSEEMLNAIWGYFGSEQLAEIVGWLESKYQTKQTDNTVNDTEQPTAEAPQTTDTDNDESTRPTPTGVIKSPLNYTGGKTKLLPQILPLFPSVIKGRFIDLFCGGANVAVNVKANKVVANDFNDKVVGIYKSFQQYSTEDILKYVKATISRYGLNMENAEAYNRFRSEYNESVEKNPLDLFILICFSFNHQIRFSKNGNFNMPFGKNRSQYNNTIEKNLINFRDAIEGMTFTAKDFRSLDVNKLTTDDFVYCDPPYAITCASYNEQGGWGEKDDNDLMSLLDGVNAKGVKFAMSNVLANKGRENIALGQWAERNGYKVHHLNFTYSNSSYHAKDRESKTDEVLITNY